MTFEKHPKFSEHDLDSKSHKSELIAWTKAAIDGCDNIISQNIKDIAVYEGMISSAKATEVEDILKLIEFLRQNTLQLDGMKSSFEQRLENLNSEG